MLMMFSTYMYTKYVSCGHSVNHTKVLTKVAPGSPAAAAAKKLAHE